MMVLGSASQASAATSYPTAPGYQVNVRSGPGTNYAVVRVLQPGSQVRIYCQTTGTTVTGPYGTSNIWDNISSGQYVSDAYVQTGSDGYVAPRC
ncbi:SH3 domain-containing protein [Streptomyces albogriseolus]|uniref:SH3 domain-containing protein n=1 Tax=Streptomyces TaxID=1883 RepID=UPI000B88A534|nr:SH3 domain-containing protein [Streptomyces sp. F-7]